MLLNTASSIAQPVTQLFNTTLRLGRLPNQWKTSMVVPIAKSSAKSDPGNYRPISLTSILCRLLEKHICGLIELHLSTFHPLSDHQTTRLARQVHLQAEELKLKEEKCHAMEAEERDCIRQEKEAERQSAGRNDIAFTRRKETENRSKGKSCGRI